MALARRGRRTLRLTFGTYEGATCFFNDIHHMLRQSALSCAT